MTQPTPLPAIRTFVTCLSEWSLGHRPRVWHEHLAVCLNSLAETNPDIQPVMIWRGDMGHPTVQALEDFHIPVLESDSRFDHTVPREDVGKWKPEVAIATMLKAEAPFRVPAPHLLVGDIDLLWLGKLPRFETRAAIACNLGNHVTQGESVSSYLFSVNRRQYIRHASELMRVAEEIMPQRPGCHDEAVFSRAVPREALLPHVVKNAFDVDVGSMTRPAILHFQGPKLHQIRDLSTYIPEGKETPTVSLFKRHQDRLQAWVRYAEAYRNYPLPIFEALEAANR